MHPAEPLFDARVMVLAEIVDLLVRGELTHVVPALNGLDLQSLGHQMVDRRAALNIDPADPAGGRGCESEEADPVGGPPR